MEILYLLIPKESLDILNGFSNITTKNPTNLHVYVYAYAAVHLYSITVNDKIIIQSRPSLFINNELIMRAS